MSVDIPEILYSVIDDIGRENIRMGVASNIALSESYSGQILKKCRIKLGVNANAETMATACEGILHFMLTATLIPSQRKLTVQGQALDVVIPSFRTLTKNPEKSVVIQVIKNDKDVPNIARAEIFQPIRENIWVISSGKLATGHRKYSFDIDGNFAKIIGDIHTFVASKGVFGLRLFHGENQV